MEENNKIIAEFMGRVIPEDKLEFYDENPTTHYYNSNWNWLMQVVEKIESLDGHLHICDNDVFVHFPKRIKGCVRINGESLKLSKIEAVYNACVEFIKWYNENKD